MAMITGTVVWLMLIGVTAYTFTTGPEFRTQEACVRASAVIEKNAENFSRIGLNKSKIQCVRIEK